MKRNVSPARSQGERSRTRRVQRRSNSVSSGLSTGPLRLSTFIQQHRNMEQDSFVVTPPGVRRSILTDNTDIEDPRRKSWWNQIGENSTNVLELENQAIDPINVLEEMDITLLSQERQHHAMAMDLPESSDNETIRSIVIPQRKLFTQRENIPTDRFGDMISPKQIQERKNYTLDPPESSDCESIKSIVIPQRKLLIQRENVPQDKFGEIIGARETIPRLNDTKKSEQVNNAGTKKIFHNQLRAKPSFPAALLNISPDKTKTCVAEEPKAPIHNLFGNRPTKRKNFADFILAESEDEITDIVPKVFSFQNKLGAKRRASSSSRGLRDPSPTSSYTFDIEMDDWKLLPSSTMVEHQLDVMMTEGNTPKKAMLSKLTEIESDRGSNATKESNKSVLSKEEYKSRKSKTFTKEKSLDNSVTTRNKSRHLQEDSDNGGNAEIYRKSKTFTKAKVSQVDNEEILGQNKSTEGTDQSRKSKTFTKEQTLNLESPITDEMTTQSLKTQNKSQSKVANQNISKSSIKNKSLNSSSKQDENADSEKNISLATAEPNEELNFSLRYDEDDQEMPETNISNSNTKTSKNSIQNMNVDENDHHEKSIENQSVVNNNLQVEDEIRVENRDESKIQNTSDVENNHEQGEDNEQNKSDQYIQKIASENEEDMDQSKVLNESEVGNQIENKQNESKVEENDSQEEHNGSDVEEQNESKEEHNDSIEHNEGQEEENQSQEEQNETTTEENESQDEQNECEVEEQNESQEVDEETEEIEQNESETENEKESVDIAESDNEDDQDVANDSDHQGTDDQADSLEDDDQVIESGPDSTDNRAIGTSNLSHYTTSSNRTNKIPEAVRESCNFDFDTSRIHGRNTTARKTEMIKTMTIHEQSQVSARASTSFSDGTRNSSADRSEWDSHRVTRKTLRKTFGKEFTPRKSLRAMVTEKMANRQTQNDMTSFTTRFPQANSTELPETTNRFDEDMENQPANEVSPTRQITVDEDEFFAEIRKRNRESRLKAEQVVRNMFAPQKPTTAFMFQMPLKSVTRRAKPAPKVTKPKPSANQLNVIPEELLRDMNYRPPKRFAPRDAPWATKRLYKYLEAKLEPKYDYKARVRAERLVETIYHFTKGLGRLTVADAVAVDTLKREMARLNIVKTHFDFYQFVRKYLPREVRIKVNPDIINKISMPREGVFGDIIS